MIGCFGEIDFVVSKEKTVSFEGFTRETASVYENHQLIGQKPRTEFVAPGLDTVSFTVLLKAQFGVSPRDEMNRWIEYARSGNAETLTIGGKDLGVDKWVVTSVSQQWDTVFNMGELVTGKIDVTLQEYVEAMWTVKGYQDGLKKKKAGELKWEELLNDIDKNKFPVYNEWGQLVSKSSFNPETGEIENPDDIVFVSFKIGAPKFITDSIRDLYGEASSFFEGLSEMALKFLVEKMNPVFDYMKKEAVYIAAQFTDQARQSSVKIGIATAVIKNLVDTGITAAEIATLSLNVVNKLYGIPDKGSAIEAFLSNSKMSVMERIDGLESFADYKDSFYLGKTIGDLLMMLVGTVGAKAAGKALIASLNGAVGSAVIAFETGGMSIGAFILSLEGVLVSAVVEAVAVKLVYASADNLGSDFNEFLEKKSIGDYGQKLIGVITSTGTKITRISNHATERMIERNITPDIVKDTITNPSSTYPGNSPNTTCYQKGNIRIVVGDDGTIISVIDLGRR